MSAPLTPAEREEVERIRQLDWSESSEVVLLLCALDEARQKDEDRDTALEGLMIEYEAWRRRALHAEADSANLARRLQEVTAERDGLMETARRLKTELDEQRRLWSLAGVDLDTFAVEQHIIPFIEVHRPLQRIETALASPDVQALGPAEGLR